MKKYILTLAILTCCFNTSSQNVLGKSSERGGFSQTGSGSQSIVNYSNFEGGIKGHKYFTDAWTHGILVINDTVNSPRPKLQYDLTTGDVILGGKDDVHGFAIDDKSLTGFSIYKENKVYNFVRIDKNKFKGGTDRNYFYTPVVSQDKNIYLILDYRKKLKEPKLSKNGYTTVNQDKVYKKSQVYYILNKEGKYVKIGKLRKNNVLKALGDKSLKKYIKYHNLNMKNERDVYNLLQHYHKS